ncbi:MAG TPA: hypothetical protein VNJ01_14875 [Bacteriovoracaceae bacterium]|nr:hypothetical protein [Bacteriovoracaceae bacterium]
MKTAIALFSLFIIASVSDARACSMPPDSTYIQPAEYKKILDTPAIVAALREVGGKDIKSISAKSGFYEVKASNNCFVNVGMVYISPAHLGLCPRLLEAQILAASCR